QEDPLVVQEGRGAAIGPIESADEALDLVGGPAPVDEALPQGGEERTDRAEGLLQWLERERSAARHLVEELQHEGGLDRYGGIEVVLRRARRRGEEIVATLDHLAAVKGVRAAMDDLQVTGAPP